MNSKKIMSLLISITVALSLSITSVQAHAVTDNSSTITNQNDSVSVEEAKNVAINQIVGDVQTSTNSNWKSGIKISKTTALFNLDNNPSAYLFELKDLNGNDCGDIVVSASKSQNPIIEYSSQGKCFLNTAKLTTQSDVEKHNSSKKVNVNNTKLYYLGNSTYIDEFQLNDNTKQAYNISTSNYTKVNVNALKTVVPNKTYSNKYIGIWNYMSKLHINSKQLRSSNPPDNGSDFIYFPSQYESGYSSSSSKDVTGTKDATGYEAQFNRMSEFHTGGVCTPTAATNLCECWANRGGKYSKLENGSWQGTFNSFYTLMRTSPSKGTPDVNVAPAYERFFANVGLNCHAYFYQGTESGEDIVGEVNNDRPSHLILHNNRRFGDHSVVALGYKQFTYLTRNSTYIRIEDGWIDFPIRYVWGGCYGTWNYVAVVPY